MKENTVGIELTSYKETEIVGRLVKTKIHVGIDEGGCIFVKQEIVGPFFTMNLSTGKFGIHSGIIDDGLEIGRRLKEIGFNPTKLVFNREEYDI